MNKELRRFSVPTALAAIFLLLFALLSESSSQNRNTPNFRVMIRVSADDKDNETDLKLHLSRELRSINDLELSGSGEYIFEVTSLTLTNPQGKTVGQLLSYLFTKRVSCDVGVIRAYIANGVATGSPDDLRNLTANIVTKLNRSLEMLRPGK